MAKRPIDYTAQMQATEERRRQQEAKQREEAQRERELRDRQAKSYSEVVREVFGRGIIIDVLAGLLLDGCARLVSNPELEAEWAAHGASYFRPAGQRKPVGDKRASGKWDVGNGDARHDGAQHGQPTESPALPFRARATASEGAADLLGGFAADQPGQGPATEGGSHGE